MYKFRVQIYIKKVQACACQKSYGRKNLVKLEGGQTHFKIPLGTRAFEKSCSTSNLAGVGALFEKFHWFFCSKSRVFQLARLPSQTKPSGLIVDEENDDEEEGAKICIISKIQIRAG